jgi:hypothetical protein
MDIRRRNSVRADAHDLCAGAPGDVTAPVARAVVDDDDRRRWHGLGPEALERGAEVARPVAHRDDDRDLGAHASLASRAR